MDLWVMGSRADDILARKAGARWVQQDYSQLEAVKIWLREHHCGLVVPGCTDVSLAAAAATAVSPHIDPPSVIDVLSDKRKFRELCRELGLPAPPVVPETAFPRAGLFICKPADSFSGRGITIFDGNNLGDFAAARRAATGTSPTASILVEEFIAGPLYSYTVFVEQFEATQAFFVQEGSSANRFAVDTSFVVRDMPAALASAFAAYVHRISEYLDLKDGLLHIQFVLRDGQPYLIEATRRCPGDLYALLIEYATGFPYAARYASYFIGETVTGSSDLDRFVVRHTVTSTRSGINSGLELKHPLPLRAFYPIQRMGEALLPDQKARSGVLFLETTSAEAANDLYESFLSREIYEDCPTTEDQLPKEGYD
ncbi:ATP-grasp domain-containing protein [Methylobacterium sp. J-026]|uniref:ATP-grasp domain-containing protein n=1 Tax=Methylobacterium sp. J-026 TaxID=2836624 RepID=UPI001FBAAB0B|nr:ATP-grasp domain-containing protein [Methylobacterium sp. J-026]MCJ2134475.1 ATP-grasp domain-containing protein [Methylobacterium sp. J-026]